MRRSIGILTALMIFGLAGAPAASAQPEGETPPTTPTTTPETPASDTPATTPAARPAAAPAPAPTPPAHNPAPAPADRGPKARGFFFEVALGGQLTFYSNLLNQSQTIGGSFLIGYKISRIIIGLGLEYYHASNYTDDGTDNDHNVLNGVIFQPTVQVHVLESNPLALYIAAGIHAGFAIYDETGTTQDDDTSTVLTGFHVGIGIRYFLHPRFAIGIEGGFRGLWVLTEYDPTGPGKVEDTTAIGAFYGRIGFSAIW